MLQKRKEAEGRPLRRSKAWMNKRVVNCEAIFTGEKNVTRDRDGKGEKKIQKQGKGYSWIVFMRNALVLFADWPAKRG